MTSRDSKGLIQIPDKPFFDSRKLPLMKLQECSNCKKLKKLHEVNNLVCDSCFCRLLDD